VKVCFFAMTQALSDFASRGIHFAGKQVCGINCPVNVRTQRVRRCQRKRTRRKTQRHGPPSFEPNYSSKGRIKQCSRIKKDKVAAVNKAVAVANKVAVVVNRAVAAASRVAVSQAAALVAVSKVAALVTRVNRVALDKKAVAAIDNR
jgi:hypothetical protein